MRRNNILKSIALSIAALAVGFFAISLPFNLFDMLTKDAMHIVFISEIVIYFAVAMVYLALVDKKKQEEIKEEKRLSERNRKIERVQREWIDIAA